MSTKQQTLITALRAASKVSFRIDAATAELGRLIAETEHAEIGGILVESCRESNAVLGAVIDALSEALGLDLTAPEHVEGRGSFDAAYRDLLARFQAEAVNAMARVPDAA